MQVVLGCMLSFAIGAVAFGLSSGDLSVGVGSGDALYENCGYGAVYMTLQRFGRAMSREKLKELCQPELSERGISVEELKSLLDACDLPYRETAGKVNRITECLDDGGVVFATLEDDMHVVVHMASTDGKVLMYDPPYRVSWIPVADLKFYWEGYGIAVFPDKISLENSADANSGRPVIHALTYAVAAVLLACGVYLIASSVSGARKQVKRNA